MLKTRFAERVGEYLSVKCLSASYSTTSSSEARAASSSGEANEKRAVPFGRFVPKGDIAGK